MQQQSQQQQKQQASSNTGGQKPQASRHSRNNKKQHHATHEAGGHHTRNKNRHYYQSNTAALDNSGYVACKLCNQELQDIEKEFFPCNCKYKICQKCFLQHVDNENGKCPNCGLLYEVKRVKDHYASKSTSKSNQQLLTSARRKTRCDSPLPTSAPSVALCKSIPVSASVQNIQDAGAATGGQALPPSKQHGNNQGRPKQSTTYGQNTTKQTKGNKNANRQSNQNAPKQTQASGQTAPSSIQESQLEVQSTSKAPSSHQNHQTNPSTTKQKAQQQQRSQQQQLAAESRASKKQRNSSEQQRTQQKLNTVRILQRNTLYVIGLSPNVAKEETLRRFEYFGQYGRIVSVTINKEKAFQSENQGLCYSAYINYASEREASLSILAVDQFVFDGRLLHASYGRTKYCRFFLKGTNCLNHECPYLHKEAHPENILTQEDMNKKILFQQCQQLALRLSKLTQLTEEQFRVSLRTQREQAMRALKLSHTGRIIMPQIEQIFEKKGLFKHCIAVHTQQIPSSNPAAFSQPQQTQLSHSHHSNGQFGGTHASSNQQKNSSNIQAGANKTNSSQITPFTSKQSQKQPLTENQQQHSFGNLAANPAASIFQVGSEPSKPPQRSAFKQHRGSEGCNSDMPSSHPKMMMMFGGRMRLQSSGNLGELGFNNQNDGIPPSSQTRFQQLVPNGVAAQSRRFAQDDHYLTRVPPSSRLTGNLAHDGQSGNNMNFYNARQHQYGQRIGSPVPMTSQFYFQSQSFAPKLPQQNQASKMQQLSHQPNNLASSGIFGHRDSDKATHYSGSYLRPLRSFHQLSQVNQPLAQNQQAVQDGRARSGSQAAAAFGAQFEEAKLPKLRRKSSDGKYRILRQPRKMSPSPGNKEEQRRFAEALREALQQFVKGGGDTQYEGISTGHYSSIFTGGERLPPTSTRIINLQQINCSEGIAGGQACSPIRDGILHSRRNSEDYGTLNRPRSQHSLIVESVARILDDTALDQNREKQLLMQPLNEPYFKTGPPSEAHKIKPDENIHGQFQTEYECKLTNQFDLKSSNSVPVNSAAKMHPQNFPVGKQHLQIGQSENPMQASIQQTQNQSNQAVLQHFASPAITTTGVWNKSNSFYNSPFFLIPTHTNNQQHRSAAFHDMSLRHLPSQFNPFSFNGTGPVSANLGKNGGGMVSDTWRLTYDPHPLLPRQPHQGEPQSSNLSSGGATGPLFRNATTTKSDQEHLSGLQPMLSRTVSQPFMMRSEQKVIRQAAPEKDSHRNRLNNSQLQMSSQLKQAQLTQRNLELLNKKYCPSKDMLYAKIFTDYQPSSPSNPTKRNQVNSFGGVPQHPISVQHFAPQSLFCFALDGDESNELRQQKRSVLKAQKQISRDDAAGILSTPSRYNGDSLFFNPGNQDKVKETSQTPTNKYSRRGFVTNWNTGVDTQSQKNEDFSYRKNINLRSTQNEKIKCNSSGLIPQQQREGSAGGCVSKDELEMANQLANEASLGFGDLFSLMHSKSRKSQYAADAVLMSRVDAECPPYRSRSQSYRDRMPTDHDGDDSFGGFNLMFREAQNPTEKDQNSLPISSIQRVFPRTQDQATENTAKISQRVNNVDNQRMVRRDGSVDLDSPKNQDKSPLSDTSVNKQRGIIFNKQNVSQQQSSASATTTGGQKSFYQEFVKVQEGLRRNSGLMVSKCSSIGAPNGHKRRNSYSQGRNSSHRDLFPTRQGSFKGALSRRSLLLSPLGLLKFKNHQIDEVAEDGATARDERSSKLMNSADGQSYNLNPIQLTSMKSTGRSSSNSMPTPCRSQNRNPKRIQ